ncbi:hypothetical protein HHI36_022698 [Cryptolaemus montrouzieri]|uniref:Uncharacterized protein n=1 Tax=Cryptolaemus montrouzieri TaxID=559131 RepID=A0ABD2N1L9_9CUCU
MVRLDAQHGNPNLNISSEDVYAFFINRCKEKLHVILSLDICSNILRNKIGLFQSLMKNCIPIWFSEWSNSALMDISNEWLKDCNITSETKLILPETFVQIFLDSKILTANIYNNSGEKYNITTSSYIEFLRLYVDIMEIEQKAVNEKKEKYLTGLKKLKYADNQISRLQENLAAYQLQLKIMSKKAAEMTRQIARETLEVERASNLVRKDEKIANKQAEAAAVLKLDCEADLAQAIPILEDAIQALNTLKPSDITLVKSMKNPPDAIKLVMAAVCVIKDVKPDRIPDPSTGRKLIDYWGPSKRILGDMNFLQSLKDFDKDHIKTEIMVKIRKDYLPHKDFKPHVVAKASSAAEGLCKWIIAMDMYDNVAKEVAPKKDKLEKAEREYAQTVAIMDEKKLEVVRLEKQLAQLNSKLQEANKKQQRLQRTADACSRKLERSVTLLSGFGNEKTQWSKKADDLEDKYQCLGGDVLLVCAAISYLSPLPTVYREEALDRWYLMVKHDIRCSNEWDLTNILVSDGNIDLAGLPKENYFKENCIIYKYCYRWPLFIDPQGLSKKWIQKTTSKHLLVVVKYGDPNLIKDVESSIESGKCLVIENIAHQFSHSFNNLLRSEFVEENGEKFVLFEGKKIVYNDGFKLVLITSLRSPNYGCEVSNNVKVINFSLTKSALQKKLLNLVIKTENPLSYEVKILRTLSDSEADLLEDIKALKTLDDTKKLSEQTAQAIYIPDNVVSTFDHLEKSFTEFSHYSSSLFVCIDEFCRKKIDFDEYEFLFRREKHERAKMRERMLERINHAKNQEQFEELKNDAREKIESLEGLDCFIGLKRSMDDNDLIWNAFLSLENPEQHDIPVFWQQKLSSFQKFLLIQTMRADRTKECMKKFITLELGEKYIEPLEIDLDELYAESYCLSPILFLSRNNTFPLSKIEKFAIQKKFINKFRYISLGDAQSYLAENLIREGQNEGLWICLINCHLSKSWVYDLERICEEMTYENTNENFRLWLISDVSFQLSDELLERCVKVIYEDSESFKDKLLISYKDCVDDVSVDDYRNYSQLVIRLIYRIVCFHSVVIWRQKFGGIAWNNPFDFGEHDLKVVTKMVSNIVNIYDSDEALGYLIGECCYSSQFLNQRDYEVSNILFHEFICLNNDNLFSYPSKSDIHDFIDHIQKLPFGKMSDLLGFNDIILYRNNVEDYELFSSYLTSINTIFNDQFEIDDIFDMIDKVLNILDIEIETRVLIKKSIVYYMMS